ncbi:acetoin utilization protein AcuC [Paenibacillus sp. MBLB4367]|uniref:acetoin utilization protein AcuC n=1 Tax=Paenibacillus sp. MBLB4367 TaxID=3384767 RepID=UPI003908160F
MSGQAMFVYNPNAGNYFFNDGHPFNPKRLRLTIDLLERVGALSEGELFLPRKAEEAELLLVHNASYIQAVKALSVPSPDPALLPMAEAYGFMTEDTPFFAGMHEATSHVVGGSLAAAEQVMEGRVKRALHLGGGLHHAMPNGGSGFSVYNDASVAIAHIRSRFHARVLYIDTDVHHGDGVQWTFYTEPDVCTFSIHETGKFLFPGTGFAHERGDGEGFGACYNMPVQPYTEDESWLHCFEELLESIAGTFKPDLIVSQHGCDAHAYDPLSHIHCSMNIYLQMPLSIRKLADRYCEGRWVALGGGGYDIWRVVPRAWSLLWLVMKDHPLIGQLGADPSLKLPSGWLEAWQPDSPLVLPDTWLDPVQQWTPMPRRKEITAENLQIKDIAMVYLPPKK